MKITKFVHSCLLVEMPEPVNRTALFDPGSMSEQALGNHNLEFLDDIIITHGHGDHLHLPLIQKLVKQFPSVRVTAPSEVVEQLGQAGITATSQPSDGIILFDAPHEDVEPLFPVPQQIGVHYLDTLTDPGDSHSFTETKAILALPVQAPWGSTVNAVNLALSLKPQHIIPIHDWHWSEAARTALYDQLADVFAKQGIMFHKPETGQAFVIDL